jgi:hypothetical protein
MNNNNLNDKLRSGAYVRVLKESGFYEALFGLSLSYRTLTPLEINGTKRYFNDDQHFLKLCKIAETLAFKGGGHNKFLESIQVWMLIRGSLSFWKQFDTYRVGITKQSESTMHTLKKRQLTKQDFTEETFCIPTITQNFSIDAMRDSLPSGFLECRVVNTNYKTLQNIIFQRQNHRSKKWNTFIEMLLQQIQHPEFLVNNQGE